jgi:hypothetical protein
MISRRTSSVPKEDDLFPKLLYCDSRCSLVCPRHSLVLPGLSSALPGLSPACTVTLKVGRNVLLPSDSLLKLTHLSLHSTSSQTISNNPSFRLKHPGVPDGYDGSDGTSHPLTENYTLPVAQATGRVAQQSTWEPATNL